MSFDRDLLTAVLFAAVAAALAWWWADRPVPVADSWDQPVASVSFAPYRRYQDPIADDIPSPGQIRQDLEALKGHALAVRTYSVRDGLDQVVPIAQAQGIKVTLGIWLNAGKTAEDARKNDEEMALGISLANRYPDTVTRILVGNEVLLRRDLTADQLIADIGRVKAAVRQPVSYADVWAFYLKNPQVAQAVDFLTIHILPFWEDEPVPLSREDQYIPAIVGRIRTAFPGKPILIGETGWPSLGRDRGPAVVSLVNEATYVRRLAALAARDHFDYNIVEAFDQPWKALLENTVGAYWGILDAERHPKFAMSGPVTETPDWPLRAALALLLGGAMALGFGRGLRGMAAALALALLGQLLSWAVVTTFFHTAAVSFRWWQFLWQPLRAGLPALLMLATLARASGLLRDPAAAPAPDPWKGELLMRVFAGYAVVWSFLLAIDGRYRDIPDVDFSLPCVALLALAALRLVRCGRFGMDGLFAASGRRRLTRWLGWSLVVGAVLALLSEGVAVIGEDFARDHPTFAEQLPLIVRASWSNREMNLWALMQAAMGAVFLAGRRAKE